MIIEVNIKFSLNKLLTILSKILRSYHHILVTIFIEEKFTDLV